MKVYIKTFGCTANHSDSEVMAGELERCGIWVVGCEKDADVVVLNLCTVKGDIAALKQIRDTAKNNSEKKIIVAGCLTKKLVDNAKKIGTFSFVSTHNIDQIVYAVEQTANENFVEITGKKNIKKVNIPRIRVNSVVGIIPILSGCAGSCSYCSVKLIKGDTLCYPEKDILSEANKAVKDGCKELWITSQDNACYFDLAGLLSKILAIKGDFFVRLGMMNPNNVDRLIEIYKHPKMFKFLHLPVQSGSDKILKLMNRKYNINQFKQIISEFRKAIPEITVSTDIIVGFPGETDEDFQKTIKLIREVKQDVFNISRFKAREGTKAASMSNQVPGNISKERSRIMAGELCRIALEKNKKWIGWKGTAVVDEIAKNNTFVARNYCYKPIILTGKHMLGEIVNVEIKKATARDLRVF